MENDFIKGKSILFYFMMIRVPPTKVIFYSKLSLSLSIYIYIYTYIYIYIFQIPLTVRCMYLEQYVESKFSFLCKLFL